MSLIRVSVLSPVNPYDTVEIWNFGYAAKLLQIPTTYCWTQTYVTYSYYEDKKYLLYKNMGMVLGRLNAYGRPNPLIKFRKKIQLCSFV